MTQANDYDKWAAIRQMELKAGERPAHKFVEKPAMKKLLPNLESKKVLLLGCGTGEETVLLEKHGAKNILGIDLSRESVSLAQESYPKHTFSVGDMHELEFDDESFDFIYSSLTIHYSERPADVYKQVFRLLKPGGLFQFSVAHPVRWASERIEIDGIDSKVLGYSENSENKRLYGTYSTFKQYIEKFPNGEILKFWVAPPSSHFSLLRETGFIVDSFVETQAIEECKAVDEYYFTRNHEFPQFSVFVARK